MEKGMRTIADHYGKEHQTIKATEELAELIQALARGDEANIKEEIADVLVMIGQLQHLYGISEIEISRMMFRKITRQIERISNRNKA